MNLLFLRSGAYRRDRTFCPSALSIADPALILLCDPFAVGLQLFSSLVFDLDASVAHCPHAAASASTTG